MPKWDGTGKGCAGIKRGWLGGSRGLEAEQRESEGRGKKKKGKKKTLYIVLKPDPESEVAQR